MTLVFAAIAPHGGLVFEQPTAPTRQGMDELARRFEAARPDAVIFVTPHGHSSTITSASCAPARCLSTRRRPTSGC